MDAAPFHPRGGGAGRLLEHCAALARITGTEGLSARARLERELGSELADLLVGALAHGPQARPAYAA